jgi:CDP-paratose 2-epimerase
MSSSPKPRTGELCAGPREKPQRQPTLGMVEWFRPGQHERVDRVLADLNRLGVSELRTCVS